jgi:glutamate-5-semialdehyde dehydrogenase
VVAQSSKGQPASSASSTIDTARRAKQAAHQLPGKSGQERSIALKKMADKLEASQDQIFKANELDLKVAGDLVKQGELSQAALGRLNLDRDKLRVLLDGIRQLAQSEDPIGKCTWGILLDDNLELYRVSCPIGVVGVIFESRPDVLPQIISLCVRTANACILKGGQEAKHSNSTLFQLVEEALLESDMPTGSIALLESRSAVEELLQAEGLVDLIIPRGSNKLVSHIQKNTAIPVLGHAEGICHIYVDRAADLKKAERIIVDAKAQYPTACNAVETVLIHKDIDRKFLVDLVKELQSNNVSIRADHKSAQPLPEHSFEPASESDWSTEYSDLILAIKSVDSIETAIEHINHYGSHHTDTIITEDKNAFEQFFAAVDSAGVFLNASTRFSDGYRYGFGAEVGISTGKLHPRGPVGLSGLVTYKYKLLGSGQVVSDYVGPEARSFLHKPISTD